MNLNKVFTSPDQQYNPTKLYLTYGHATAAQEMIAKSYSHIATHFQFKLLH